VLYVNQFDARQTLYYNMLLLQDFLACTPIQLLYCGIKDTSISLPSFAGKQAVLQSKTNLTALVFL
jgi:hypothetical protein